MPSREQIMQAGGIPDDWAHREWLSFKPVADLRNPEPGYVFNVKDSWWIVHPTLGAIFSSGVPQCDQDRDKVLKTLYENYPGASTIYLHSALFEGGIA